MVIAELLAAYDAAPDRAAHLWALPEAEAEALARALARRHLAPRRITRHPAGPPQAPAAPAPPPPPGLAELAEHRAAELLAALVELARRDARKGDTHARAWLEAYVEAPAARLLAAGRVRVAA